MLVESYVYRYSQGDLVHLDGIKWQKVNCCKYLGIFIDCNMKWSEHIEYFYNKLNIYLLVFFISCEINY